MKIVFFGTPDYVLPILDSLHKTFKTKAGESPIVSVVTQAPKPVGREKKTTYSPVDTWAYKKKIPIFYKSKDIVKDKIDADLGILAAYGEIIPKLVIDHLKFGILNIHPSLLPNWRGASPVQAAIVAGDKKTGVTIIKLDEKLDHGPIISQFTEEIYADDTTETLRRRLFERAAEAIVTLIPPYQAGKITPRSQDDSVATFTTQTTKENGFIPPEYVASTLQGQSFKGRWQIPFVRNLTLPPSATVIYQFIRAMEPWPQAWTFIQLTEKQKNEKTKKRLKILKAHVEKPLTISHQPLIIDTVQLEGKNPVFWKQFKQAYPEAKFAS